MFKKRNFFVSIIFNYLIILQFGESASIKNNDISEKSFYSRGVSRDRFIPFGIEAGDTEMFKNDDSFVGPIPISSNFLFFNSSYSSLFVNTNGLISFRTGVPGYTPIPFPIRDVIGVSPYWNDIDTTKGGDIYYREITDLVILNDIGKEIRRAFNEFANFRPTWAYVATWLEVAAYSPTNPRVNNTFQAIIATNGRHSFTIYNYEKLMWSRSTNINAHAQAGFNAGDNSSFYILEGSFTASVINITEKSNVGIPGKWIFRIDDSSISEGGCSTEGLLTVNPLYVFFAGGEDLTITGPCFRPDDSVELVLDNNKIVNCEVFDTTTCSCETPYIGRKGKIPLKLTINGNATFNGYLISKDVPLKEEIFNLNTFYLNNRTEDVIRIEWSEKFNPSELNQRPVYELHLIIVTSDGFYETKLLKENITGNNTNISLSSLLNQLNSDDDIKNSYLALNYVNRDFKKHKKSKSFLPSKFWLLKKAVQLINIFDRDYDRKCRSWHSDQPNPEPYLNGLPPCWRSLPLTSNGQLQPIFGEFEMDEACNPNQPKGCQTFHPGAKVCYRSTTSFTLGPHTAGQQCCYDNRNNLLVGPPGGGTLDLGHSNNKWDHFKKDVEPYFFCCVLSRNCNLYYEKRPSDDGRRWTPPRPAGGTGDPHFTTLDKVVYTFNGYGEYTFLEIKEIDFIIQVRLAPFKQNDTLTEGTVFKGIAIKGNRNVDKIQFEIDSSNNLLFFLNNILTDINDLLDESLEPIALNELYMIYEKDVIYLQYLNGISIEIKLTQDNDAFLIFTTAPNKFNNKTKGLIGVMNNDKTDDFTLPDGTVLNIDPENDKEIFENFGQRWLTTNRSSIFTYLDNFQHYNYVNTSYVPKFISDGIEFDNPELEAIAIEKCDNNKKCLYDISMTGNLGIANLTIELDKQIVEFEKEINTQIEKVCEPLQIDNGNVEIVNDQTLSYTFSCIEKYCLNGTSSIKCSDANQSNLPKCTICKTNPTSSAISLNYNFFYPKLLLLSLITFVFYNYL